MGQRGGLGFEKPPQVVTRVTDGGPEQVQEARRSRLSQAEPQVNSREARRSWRRAWPFSRERPPRAHSGGESATRGQPPGDAQPRRPGHGRPTLAQRAAAHVRPDPPLSTQGPGRLQGQPRRLNSQDPRCAATRTVRESARKHASARDSDASVHGSAARGRRGVKRPSAHPLTGRPTKCGVCTWWNVTRPRSGPKHGYRLGTDGPRNH